MRNAFSQSPSMTCRIRRAAGNCDWGEGNILSLFRGVDVPLEPGMAFHVPITLREYNKFTVAVSETVLVTETGPRTFSTISREFVQA